MFKKLKRWLKRLWEMIKRLFQRRVKKPEPEPEPEPVPEPALPDIPETPAEEVPAEPEPSPIFSGKFRRYSSGDKTIFRESFNSIGQLVSTLNSRHNNPGMAGCHSSSDGDFDFTGTSSYEEAEKLLVNGYTEVLSKIQNGVDKNVERLTSQDEVLKSLISNDLVGFAPNVPNYLMGNPNNMIHRTPVIRKTKAITIIYSSSIVWHCPAEDIQNAGIALLSAINIIEKYGVAIRLESLFKGARTHEGDNVVLGLLTIKDFDEKLSFQKVCFPIAHPSMLRRIGFKFLETVPNLETTDFQVGYGRPLRIDEVEQYCNGTPNRVCLNVAKILNLGCDVTQLIEYIVKRCQKEE